MYHCILISFANRKVSFFHVKHTKTVMNKMLRLSSNMYWLAGPVNKELISWDFIDAFLHLLSHYNMRKLHNLKASEITIVNIDLHLFLDVAADTVYSLHCFFSSFYIKIAERILISFWIFSTWWHLLVYIIGRQEINVCLLTRKYSFKFLPLLIGSNDFFVLYCTTLFEWKCERNLVTITKERNFEKLTN